MGRISVETVYALLQEYKKQMDGHHAENSGTLKEILEGVNETNGQVRDHDRRIGYLERRHASPVVVPPETKDWKVIGAGVGAIVLTIWGAVEVLRLGFSLAAKLGAVLTGTR